MTVLKRGGRRERFDRQKLLRGLVRAANKRPVSDEQLEGLAESIAGQVRRGGPEVEAGTIGDLAERGLARTRPGGGHPVRLGLPQSGRPRRARGGRPSLQGGAPSGQRSARPRRLSGSVRREEKHRSFPAQGSPQQSFERGEVMPDSRSAAAPITAAPGGVSVPRRFTDDGVHPFDCVEWEIRDAAHRRPGQPGLRAARGRVPQELVAERHQHRRPEVLPRALELARARVVGQADDRPRGRHDRRLGS